MLQILGLFIEKAHYINQKLKWVDVIGVLNDWKNVDKVNERVELF